MNNISIAKKYFSRTILALSCGLAAVAANAVTNTYTILDTKEIADFSSGYDISRVEFTLIDSETLQIDVIPYGVPGDADGNGNPDTSSNSAIADSPGVSGLEFIYMGMICNYTAGSPCEPNLNITFSDNVLSATTTSGNDVTEHLSFQLIDAIDNDGKLDTYRLTINNLSTVRTAVLGYVPTVVTFGSFTFSAHIDDALPDDSVPDAIPGSDALVCQAVELVPPVTTAPGTGTIGYWKNHPSEWPANCDLTLPGSANNPSMVFAMNVLEAPVKGDKTVILAKQVVGARLNICAGNATTCTVGGVSYDIDQTIKSAMAWLTTYGPVFIKQKNWYEGDVHQETLDDYNNGKLCAPYRSD